MSSIWTPGGERPVPPRPPEPPSTPPPGAGRGEGGPPPGAGPDALTPEDAERLQQLTRELMQTPAATIVANHAMGLFELAALHLSQPEPRLEEARLAIDGMAAMVEGLAGRLGEAEPTLKDAVAQLRMAFVQIKAAQAGTPVADPPA